MFASIIGEEWAMRTLTSIEHARAALCCVIAAACAAEPATEEPPAASPLTVPVPPLNQYVVLASRAASFGDRTRVTGGDIGVAASTTPIANTLFGGHDSRIGVGEVLLAPRIVLFPRAVAGEIATNRLEAPLAITGPRSPYVAPPAQPVPASIAAGTVAVHVPFGQTRQLAAGRFAQVTVNGTLDLGGGTYEVANLFLGPGARVNAAARSNLRVIGSVFAADRARIQAPAPLRAGDLRLTVAGPAIILGTDVRLVALVVARGIFASGDRLIGSGAIAAQDLVVGNDAALAFDTGFGCSSAAGCDDGNPCTADACSDAECLHTAVADGTLCSDGNACTRSDVCQAGACAGSDPVICELPDQCHEAGSCDPASGVCSNPAKPDGAACDDGDPCSHGDSCSSGVCTRGTELEVSEFDTGLSQPSSIISGPLGSLWFVSPETSAGSLSGAIARFAPDGHQTHTELLGRFPDVMIEGPDGALWVGQRLLGGLPALSRFEPGTGALLSDFVGILAVDLAQTNGAEGPIVWFTGGNSVERITPAGTRLAAVPTRNSTRAITVARSEASSVVWITEANTGSGVALIGRIDFPRLVQFSIDTPGELSDLVEGPDRGIWFTDGGRNEIGRLAPGGDALETYAIPSANADPRAIAVGPDENLWFTQRAANKLGRITTSGQITEVCVPTPASEPTHVTAGADGNVWFTAPRSGKLGRVRLSP
jgi:streptogramin lyase